MILLYGAGGGPGRDEIPMDLFRKQASDVFPCAWGVEDKYFTDLLDFNISYISFLSFDSGYDSLSISQPKICNSLAKSRWESPCLFRNSINHSLIRFFRPESDSGFGTFSHPPRRRLLSHFSHQPNCIGLYPKNRL